MYLIKKPHPYQEHGDELSNPEPKNLSKPRPTPFTTPVKRIGQLDWRQAQHPEVKFVLSRFKFVALQASGMSITS